MSTDLPAYRIFIASPSDVPEERARALRVVERLRGEFADQLHLSAIAWERKTYSAHSDFQAQIEATRDCHLVVGVLWQRIGTPLDALRYPREDGTPFESGTVFEIETALDLRRAGPLPDVALFKKRAPPQAALSAEDARQLAQDLPLLEAITRRWFRTDSGAFKAAFNDFTSPEHFEALLEQHLRAWLAERGHSAEGRVWRIETDGSPYPGLSPYDAERERVFFGRDRARLAGRIALSEAAARGCPFLLIVGGSGAGKSSLARAGLLPSLALPGSAPGVDGWCVATLRPGPTPVSALAEAIFDALPAMAGGDAGTPGEWAATLLARPPAAAGAVARALEREGAGGRRLRLLLLADQLEEAFDAPPAQRDAFAGALAALVQGGQWVVATLRADRYAALLDQPDLVALQEVGATQNLRPPDAEDIEAIIRGPARAAGLVFERRGDGRDLAQILQEEMEGADALPLLQMALARLFVERDRGANRLTFAAHAAMGGLRGAIQARADALFAEADAAAQAELPAVLLALAAGLSEAGLAIARPVAEVELATTDARRALLRVLVEGRLLVAERAASGAVQLRVAHEALLRNWPQATRILAPEHLGAKPRLEAALADWRDRGAKRRDLLRGTMLEAGLGLLRAHARALPPALAAFIARSRQADRWRRFGLLGGASGAAAVFGVLALLAWDFAREAEREARRADQQAQEAETARAEAVREAGRATGEQAIAIAARAMAEEQRAQAVAEAARADRAAADTAVALGVAEQQRASAEAEAARAEREAAAAEAARARAEIGFAAARDTASSLVFELAVGLRNREGMPTALVRDLLDLGGRALDALLARTPDDPATLRLRGVAYGEFATTFARLGDTPRQRGAAEQALRIFAQLAERDPSNTGWQHNLTASHERLGLALRAQGDLPGALLEYRAGMAIRIRLAERDTANTEWQRSLSNSHIQIGDVLQAQGDLVGALREYRASMAISARLAERDTDNTEWQHNLTVSHERLGLALQAQGDLPGALREYRASTAIRIRLAERDTANTEWQRSLSYSHSQIGLALHAQGDLAGALREYRASMAISARLAERDTDNTEWQRDLSNSHSQIGDVLRAQGDGAGALRAYRAGMAIRTRLAERDTTNIQWQRDLSNSHSQIGDVLRAQGDGAGALREYRASMAISSRLAERDTANTEWQRSLSNSHSQIGLALHAQGDLAGALRSYRTGIAIAARLAERDTANNQWQSDLSTSHIQIGAVMRQQGDFVSALQEYRAAMAIRTRLTERDTDNTEWQHDLSFNHHLIGDVLQVQGDLAGALREFRAGMAIRTRLAERDPADTRWQRDTGVSHGFIGDIYLRLGEVAAARPHAEAALAIAQNRRARFPDQPQTASDLAAVQALLRRIEAAAR
jgi:tetratricopeptide (TPR) repeat protein